MLKKISLVVVLLQVFFTNTAFTQNQNSSSEEEAIKSVIINETKSWADRNYEGMTNAFAHEEYVLRMFPGPNSYYEDISWDSISVHIKSSFKKYSSLLNIDFIWSDWNIRVFNNCAWASFKQKYNYDGKTNESREVRFLEKEEGIWKIVYINAVYTSDYKEREESAENDLNYVGYILLGKNKIKDAIDIFKKNVELYPGSWNVYDSLGEAYMKNGDKELAIQNYKKSLEINPQNDSGKQMLDKLEKE